jgi:hypothetical protein
VATLFRDVHSASFGGTSIPEVREVQLELGGRPVRHAADTDGWITHVDLVERVVAVELITADVEVVLKDLALSLPITGTLQFTVAAAAGGQDLAFTVTNAVLIEAGARVRHGEVASDARLSFVAYSADGAASPLTITSV